MQSFVICQNIFYEIQYWLLKLMQHICESEELYKEFKTGAGRKKRKYEMT